MIVRAFLFLSFSMTMMISCQHQSKEKWLIGKWQYYKTGYKSGEGITWKVEEDSKNYTMLFDKDGNFIFNNGQIDQLNGTYKLINEGKYIVTEYHELHKRDTTNIISLISDILQVQMTYNNILQLKKVN